MSLLDTLNNDLKTAMKSGDEAGKLALRSIKAAILNAQKAEDNQPLDDDEIMAVLRKQAKQRQDSIDAYKAAGRDDLVANESAELVVIERYLPALMDEDAIRERVAAVIARTGASSMRDMGKVMGPLMAELRGQADGRVVNQIVRELLSG